MVVGRDGSSRASTGAAAGSPVGVGGRVTTTSRIGPVVVVVDDGAARVLTMDGIKGWRR